MKIRTAQQLQDRLDADLSWRKREIHYFYSLASKYRYTPDPCDSIIRAGIILMYAHWEGYVENAAQFYMEYLCYKRIKKAEAISGLLALVLRKAIKRGSTVSSVENMMRIVKLLREENDEPLRIDFSSSPVPTANLSSSVLKDITDYLGLNYGVFERRKAVIDIKLLEARNMVAHGEDLTVDYAGFTDLHFQTVVLLDDFRNQIENAVTLKSCLRGGNPLGVRTVSETQ